MTWWGYLIAAALSASAALLGVGLSNRQENRRAATDREGQRLNRMYSDIKETVRALLALVDSAIEIAQYGPRDDPFASEMETAFLLSKKRDEMTERIAEIELLASNPALIDAAKTCYVAIRVLVERWYVLERANRKKETADAQTRNGAALAPELREARTALVAEAKAELGLPPIQGA